MAARKEPSMRTAITLLTVALAIGSAACKKKDKERAPDTGSAAMAGSADLAGSGSAMAGSAMAGSGEMAGSAAAPGEPEMAKKAGNCPSTVFGAITKSEIQGKDVVLTITSEDQDAALAIQKRTEALLKAKQEGAAGAAHDQKGSHGGVVGLCPVFLGEGGTATSKNEAKGVAVTITPKDKPEELKATIDDRIAKVARWVDDNVQPAPEGNKAGTGGGKGAHGSTHQGAGDAKGKEREGGTGGGEGTGGGGGKGTGGGTGGGTGDDKKGNMKKGG